MSVAGASPGVCLLVAAWDSSGSGLMDEAVSWSVEHGFELVEWTPASTSQHSWWLVCMGCPLHMIHTISLCR